MYGDRWIVEVEYLIADGLHLLREFRELTDRREYYEGALLVTEAYRRICEWLTTDDPGRRPPPLWKRLAGQRNARAEYVESLYQMTVGIVMSYGFHEWLADARQQDAIPLATIAVRARIPLDWVDGLPADLAEEIANRPNLFQPSYNVTVASGETVIFEVVEVVAISSRTSARIAPDTYAFAVSSRTRLIVIASDGRILDTATTTRLLDFARTHNLLSNRGRLAVARPALHRAFRARPRRRAC